MANPSRPLPKISIITPSFNQAEFLPHTMRSVLEQGYPNLEYIVMDGGSTDSSPAIIEAQADKLAYWQSKPDGGQAAAIADGLAKSTGEIMAYLNSDDMLAPGSLQFVAEYFAAHPEVDAIYSHRIFIDERNIVTRHWILPPHWNALIERWDFIPQETCFWRRSAWEKAGNIDSSYRFAMDYEFFVRMMRSRAKFVRVPRFLAAFREHNHSKTAQQYDTIGLQEIARIHQTYRIRLAPDFLKYAIYAKVLSRAKTFAASHQQLPGAWRGIGYDYTEPHEDAYQAAKPKVPPAPRPLPPMAPYDAYADHPTGPDATRWRKLRLGVDLRPISLGESGGIAQLIKGVLEAAFAAHPEVEFHLFATPYNADLLDMRNAQGQDFPNVFMHGLSPADFYPQLTHKLQEFDIDVLMRSYPSNDHPTFPDARQIVLIPDVQQEDFPEFFDFRARAFRRLSFDRATRQAGAIAAISEFSRDTIRAYPGILCRDIFIMSPALQFDARQDAPLSAEDEARLPQKPFFLFPANLWPHKNHKRVLRAFARYREKTGSDAVLILTGHPRGWEELAAEFPNLPVEHYGFVSKSLLRALYRRATALLYFTLYEGFGMPLLEAFDVDTPVACSSSASLPEIGEDAVLAVDPENVEAMADAIARIATDEELRRTLIARGKARLAHYSWKHSADELVAAGWRLKLASARFHPPTRLDVPASEAKRPLVSIVTPSYNQAQFLERTIESIAQQTYSHIEHIVKDGGSEDGSVEILKRHEEHLRWVSEKDRGQTHAINKGLAEAKGDIFAYLNSDDVLLPDAVERVVSFFAAHPDIDIVYGEAQYTNEADRITGIYRTQPFSNANLVRDCGICQPATFWRRRVYEDLGPFDESLHYTMDYEYWLRAAFSGKHFACMPLILAQSRLYAETKTMSAREKIYQEIFSILRKYAGSIRLGYAQAFTSHLMYERYPSLGRRLGRFRRLRQVAAMLMYLWLNHAPFTTKRALETFVMRVVLSRKIRTTRLARVLHRYLWRWRHWRSQHARRAAPPAPALAHGFDQWGHLHHYAFVHPSILPKKLGYIEGMAWGEGVLRASMGGQVLAETTLVPHQPVRLEIPLPATPKDRLELVFEPSVHARRLPHHTMLLSRTNLVRLEHAHG